MPPISPPTLICCRWRILKDARVEAAIAEANSSDAMQFERQGYFVRDNDSTLDRPVLNRTIGLRDTFAKEVGKT